MLPTKIINEITREQTQQIPVYVDRWLNMPLKSINKKVAFECIEKIYKNVGEEKPKIIIGQSPFQTALMALLCKQVRGQLWGQLRDQLWDQLRDQLWDQLRDQLRDQLWGQLKDQLGDQLWDQLNDQLGDQLWGQLWGQLRDQLRNQLWDQLRGQLWGQLKDQLGDQLWGQLKDQLGDQLRDQLNDQLGDQLWGQLWGQLEEINNDWMFPMGWVETYAGWLSFGDYIGAQLDQEKLDLFIKVAQNICFLIPYKEICFISEKPIEIHWRNRRLHKDGEMSFKFSDGYGMYNYDGVRIPESMGSILSERWKPEWLLTERNAEIRRVLIQGIGYGRILKSLNAKKLDSWREYELYKISDSVDVEPILLVSMKCPSTGLLHVHRISPNIKTAREAITAVNQGIDPESFEVET